MHKAIAIACAKPRHDDHAFMIVAWVNAASRAVAERCHASAAILVKVADQRAERFERAARIADSAAWKTWLADGQQPRSGGTQPTRRAFQWVRGSAGWSRGSVGPLAAEDDVPIEKVPDAEFRDADADPDDSLCRIWRPETAGDQQVPLGEQACVDHEAQSWASLRNESDDYSACFDVSASLPPAPLQ